MQLERKLDVCGQATSEERVVLEVLDAVLTQSVLSAADESADQVLGLLRHVSHLLGELEPLLGGRERGRSVPQRFLVSSLKEENLELHTLTLWFMILP